MKLSIERYAPHIVLVIALSTILAASYGASVYAPTSSSGPKVAWSPTSVTIIFSASAGSGTPVGPVSFVCTPGTKGGVQLIPQTNQPGKIGLKVNSSTFPSCNSNPHSANMIKLTASCLVAASNCVGTYSGTVTVRQPATYQDLAPKQPLTITIVVRS